jgi:hypothetical protein
MDRHRLQHLRQHLSLDPVIFPQQFHVQLVLCPAANDQWASSGDHFDCFFAVLPCESVAGDAPWLERKSPSISGTSAVILVLSTEAGTELAKDRDVDGIRVR